MRWEMVLNFVLCVTDIIFSFFFIIFNGAFHLLERSLSTLTGSLGRIKYFTVSVNFDCSPLRILDSEKK